MNEWVNTLMVSLLMANIWIIASSRLLHCIQAVAIQGIIIGILPVVMAGRMTITAVVLLAALTVSLKGIVFPYLLKRSLRAANVRREVETFVSYPLSILICILIFVLSFWLSRRLPFPEQVSNSLMISVSFSMIMSGLFMIISRAKALTQVLGYLVMENGIYVFSLAVLFEQPFLVELGILLDMFVAVFVMGIAIFHISREFDHIDTNVLSSLSDRAFDKAGDKP